jgi:putative transposase
MVRRQAFRFRLRLTGAQGRALRRTAGACRYVYNRALAEQHVLRAAGEKRLGYAALCRQLTTWRHDPATAWLAEIPIHPLQQSLRDLERAYTNAFAGRASFPVFKKKDRSRASFRYPDPNQIQLDEGNQRIRLPKIGWVRYRASRAVLGAVKTVTVAERAGHWEISIQTEREVATPVHPAFGTPAEAVGIDVGITRFATLSTGVAIAPLHSLRRYTRKLTRAQRTLARRQRGSANARKTTAQLARLHARVADARANFLHQTSHAISQTHAVVILEDLSVQAMSASARGTTARPGRRVRQKAGLNRAILDQAWGEFRRQLAYKTAWRGGKLRLVPAAYTSQRCPPTDGGCGHVAAGNRPSQARFACVACGYVNHADLVGALNIYAAGHAVSACGGDVPSDAPMKQEPTEAIQVAA